MSKRKLSRRQQWRIEKIQQERLDRAERKAARQQDGLPLSKEQDKQQDLPQEGRIIANFGSWLEVEDEHGDTMRCSLRQNLPAISVGDRVIWQQVDERAGVISAVKERSSLLVKPDSGGQLKPLAANIDQIIIVFALRPHYSTLLIDQYLVAAELNHIRPLLLLNKADLLDEQEQALVERDFEKYQQLGYPAIKASCRQEQGLDTLKLTLQDKTSVFVGQSGVGKSSLVQALLPAQEITIGDLSEGSELGRHTTSVSRLYHLPGGGDIIDSPGVREFKLWEVGQTELEQGFVEFAPYLGMCKFRDCSHTHEPDCALQEALAEGQIDPQRMDNFLHLLLGD